ncbi:polysaccharide deacetylase family protein [Streptomyces sp. NPDC048416]|uniref:polysaccharide deacetylase family protein n=1 Tax=Streptomyces sp. NPDC048416 TaxID=3365546 RepID=UPI0037135C57
MNRPRCSTPPRRSASAPGRAARARRSRAVGRLITATLVAAVLTVSGVLTAGGTPSAGYVSVPADATPRPTTAPPTTASPTDLSWILPLPSALAGHAIRRMPTQRHVVALTFNAAWNEQGVDEVLKVLDRYDVPATFFLTGQFAERHPDAARAMVTAGHGIASHSYSHPHMDELNRQARELEVRQADRALRKAIGTPPLPFFRFPYGDTTPQEIAEVNALGFADIEWADDTNGYLGIAGGMTTQKVIARALRAVVPGAIIQMHVGTPRGTGTVLDAQALPQLIKSIRARGYRITDLRSLLVGAH